VFFREALVALEEILRVGLPAVVTLSVHKQTHTHDNVPVIDALKQLAEAGATVVGGVGFVLGIHLNFQNKLWARSCNYV
jgi:hypothetical protein